MGTDDGHAAFLEERRDIAQERVVALRHGLHQPRHQRPGHIVERRGVERGARHRAGKADLGHAGCRQIVEKRAEAFEPRRDHPRALGLDRDTVKGHDARRCLLQQKIRQHAPARDDRPRAHPAQPGVR